MKKLFLVLPVLYLVSWFVSALSIQENSQKNMADSYSITQWSRWIASEKCQKYQSWDMSDRNMVEYSQCYRSEVNKLSVSKWKACGLRDGWYNDVLQFNWKFTENQALQTDNYGFTKLKNKLYYIVIDHIDGTDTLRSHYFFSYDCNTKKVKQHYEWQWLWHWYKPLWIDVASSVAYLLKWWPIRWQYDVYKVMQINLKTNSVTEYQLYDETIEQNDWTKKLVKWSFVWSESPLSKALEWVNNYGIDKLASLYDVVLWDPSIDDITNIRQYGKIWLSKITKWKWVMTITMPWYTITTDIDFNKKTIK